MALIDRKIPPMINDIKNVSYLPTEILKTSNGIDLHVISGGSSEIIQIHILFDAGTAFSNKNLLPQFANNLFKEAPYGKDPDKTAEFFDFYGCIVSGYTGNRFAGIKIILPKLYADKILPMIADLIKNPALPEKEFRILQKNSYEKIKKNLTINKFLAVKTLSTQLFGAKHPFGLKLSENDVYELKYDEISDFVKKHYALNNCKIILSGSIDDSIISLIDTNLGCLNTGDQKKLNLPHFPIKESKNNFKYIEKDGSMQSSIVVGIFLDPEKEDDIFSLNILNTVLGGYFGSRLMKNIREDKGYTYGIGSFITTFPDDRHILRIATEVGIEYTSQALDEIYNEIKKLKDYLVSNEELRNVKNYMMGEMLGYFNGPFLTANTYLKMLENNNSLSYFDQQTEVISNTDTAEIQHLAANYFQIEKLQTVIVGKKN